MQVFALGKACPASCGSELTPNPLNKAATKIMRIMKLTVILLTVAFLQVNANGFSQTITYSGKNVPLEKVFSVIKEQAGFSFIYFDEQLKDARKVTINVKNVEVEEVLAICMKDQPYDYTIKAKTIFIINRQKKEPAAGKSFTSEQGDKRINISGKVTGEQGEPVIGATITIKGTDVATSTNENGEFFLNDVEDDAVLLVTNISYQIQEIALRGQSNIDIRLKINVGNLDEAVVVAYNTTTRRRNTGAVTVVKGEQILTLPNRSFDKSLQGLVPGLLVTPGSGQPGGGVSNFLLRGIATNAEAGNYSTVRNPLIIVDGIPVSQETSQIVYRNGRIDYGNAINNPLAQLNPSDIETISVLKDAAAIALYGAKSSNGVILITTKKGRAGKTRFSFKNQFDISSMANHPEMLSNEEYMELLYETYRNSPRIIGGVSTPWTDNDILSDLKSKFPVASNGDFYEGPDWVKELYNKNATTVSNELSMSGGSDKSNFYLNIEYTDQNGLRKKTGFDRKSLRFNFENRPTTWAKIGLNSTISYTTQDYGGSAYGSDISTGGLTVLEISPLNPIYLEDGSYYLNFKEGGASSSNFPNPVAQGQYNINKNTAFRGLARLYSEINFLKYIKLNSGIGVDFMLAEAKEKNDPRLRDPLILDSGGRVEEQDTRRANLITTNVLGFTYSILGNHNINVLVGQEAQILGQKILDISVTGLSAPYYDQINSPGVTVYGKDGFNTKETLLSYFSQLNYDYKKKYLLTTSIRRDGSSRFGEDKRFGTYWSTGGGWVVSSEPFMDFSSRWLSLFKLRGSIGAAGNAGAIDRFTPYDPMQSGRYLNNIAVRPDGNRAGNADVKWENTFSWNAGLDLDLLEGRVSLSADLYNRNTTNLIYSNPIPTNTGFGFILGNLGKMRNSGLEFVLSGDIIKTKKCKWNLSANWSSNRNKLIKANNTTPAASYVLFNLEGESFNSFYLRQWAGVNPTDGSPQWIDSTGNANNNYNAAKPSIAGKSQPDGFGMITNSITVKDFDVVVMLYYQYGYKISDKSRLVNDGFYPFSNQSKNALDRWRKPGDVATNPKRVLNDPNQTFLLPSTRNLINGDHVRLQNILVSYRVPAKIISKLGLSAVKLFIQGNNLAVWASDTKEDPNSVTTSGSFESTNYPIQKSYSFGINVNF